MQAEPSLLQRLPVQVSPASQDTLLQLSAVSAVLAIWSLAQVLHRLFCDLDVSCCACYVEQGTHAGAVRACSLPCAEVAPAD